MQTPNWSRDVIDAQQNDELGASIGLENDDDLFLWNVTFEGPENTLYEVSHTPLANLSMARKSIQGLGM